MKTTIAALILFAVLPFAQAQAVPDVKPDWSTADTARQTVLTLALVVDYRQTMDIKHYPAAECWERNPILGKHPTDGQIRAYFAGAALLSYGAARVLPAGWPRQSFQYGVIALQVATMVKNKRMGLKVKF